MRAVGEESVAAPMKARHVTTEPKSYNLRSMARHVTKPNEVEMRQVEPNPREEKTYKVAIQELEEWIKV